MYVLSFIRASVTEMSGHKVLTHSFTHKHSHIISDISTLRIQLPTVLVIRQQKKLRVCLLPFNSETAERILMELGTNVDYTLNYHIGNFLCGYHASGAVRVSECYVYFCFVSDTKRPVKPMQPILNSPNSSGTEPRPLASDHQQAVCAHQAGCAGHVHRPYV